MEETLFDEKAMRAVDILQQIKKINQMIIMHQESTKDVVMISQYLRMKKEFLNELQEILLVFKINVHLKSKFE